MSWSAEGTLVVAACQVDPPGLLPSTTVDWGEVLRLAGIHAVTPSLAHGLEVRGVNLPDEVRGSLDAYLRATAATNLALAAELLDVMELLRAAGVGAIPIKGPILAQVAYGDVARREFADLDVLVRRRDVRRASRTMVLAGYKMEPPVRDEAIAGHVRADHELTFLGPQGTQVELQWDVVPRFFSVELDIDGMLGRATTVQLGGRTVPSMRPEDLVLLLAVHAGKHLWERFAWVLDLDRVVRTYPGIDWGLVRDRAAEARALRLVRLGIDVVWRGLASSWVPQVRAVLGSDEYAYRVSSQVVDSWFSADEPAGRREPESNFQLTLFRLHEHPFDQLVHAWRLFVTPSDEDVASVRIPRWAWPAYVLVRGGRLATRLFRKKR